MLAAARLSATSAAFPEILMSHRLARVAARSISALEFSFTTPLVVSTLADTIDGRYGTGELSLREALSLANVNPGIDTITFDASLYANGPATITLAYDGNDSGIVPDQLYAVLVTIQGPGADKLIISGGGQQTGVDVGFKRDDRGCHDHRRHCGDWRRDLGRQFDPPQIA